MISILEYDKAFDTGLSTARKILETVKYQIEQLDDEDRDLALVNYDQTIFTLETNIADIEKLKVRYIYDKMDREEFNLILKNIAEGKPATVITVGREHKLRTLDTLRLLNVLYNTTVEELLSYNRLTVSEFDELKEINGIIYIPTIVNLQDRSTYSNLPVFGSVNGDKALGTDWFNEIEADSSGDIRAMGNIETLQQGIENRFGEYGDIPGYEQDSIDLDWGRDYDSELIDLMTVVKISNKLLRDARIVKVEDVKITTNGLGKEVKVYVTAINGTDTIEALIKNQQKESELIL